MRCNILTLADHVEVYDRGKMVIVGTFDTILGDTFPLTHKPFGIATKVALDSQSRGKAFKANITLRKKGADEKVISIDFEGTIKASSDIDSGNMQFASVIGPIKFETEGAYILELFFNKKLIASTNIYLKKIEKKEDNTNKKD